MQTKLSDQDLQRLINELIAGEFGYGRLSKKYKVSVGYIQGVCLKNKIQEKRKKIPNPGRPRINKNFSSSALSDVERVTVLVPVYPPPPSVAVAAPVHSNANFSSSNLAPEPLSFPKPKPQSQPVSPIRSVPMPKLQSLPASPIATKPIQPHADPEIAALHAEIAAGMRQFQEEANGL